MLIYVFNNVKPDEPVFSGQIYKLKSFHNFFYYLTKKVYKKPCKQKKLNIT